jgi:hypothetical protein
LGQPQAATHFNIKPEWVKETGNGDIDVGFTRKGLEHLQHDRFPDKLVRDIILSGFDKVLERAKYVRSASDIKDNPMIRAYHYYEIKLFGVDYWINVRETFNGEVYVYTLTNKK